MKTNLCIRLYSLQSAASNITSLGGVGMFNEPSSETHFIHVMYDFIFVSTFSNRFLHKCSVPSTDGRRTGERWKSRAWPINHTHTSNKICQTLGNALAVTGLKQDPLCHLGMTKRPKVWEHAVRSFIKAVFTSSKWIYIDLLNYRQPQMH